MPAEQDKNMSDEIELYVHSVKQDDPVIVRIAAGASVEELLKKIHEAGLCEGPSEELHIFAENEAEPLARGHSVEHCGLRHRHHVHCHKCHRIQVAAIYNGMEKSDAFPPSAKVKRVLKWAIEAFQLKGADAESKVLRLADPPQTELPNESHIGSFAHPPKCELRVCLVPPIRFQG
jgi:hypothetical protein